MWHETSASTDGSVNGKWCVTNLLLRDSPKSAFSR